MNKATLLRTITFGSLMIICFVMFSVISTKHTVPKQGTISSNSENHAFNTQKTNLEQEVNSLKLEIKSINAALKHLESRFNTIPSQINHSVASGDDLESVLIYPEDIKTAEETLKQEGRNLFDEQIMIIEDNFIGESVDNDWSKEKTGAIMTALDALPVEINDSVELKATDCRSSMCRIEIEYYDEVAQSEFEMQFPMLVGEDFPSLAIQHEQHDGIIKGIYFLQSDK